MQVAEHPAPASRPDYTACSGCTLCATVCPVWRDTRDLRMSPEGRCKALQHGAGIADIARPLESCTLCGACEPVCPENIDLLGSVRQLRQELPDSPNRTALRARLQDAMREDAPRDAVIGTHRALLVPGAGLRSQTALLASTLRLLGAEVAEAISDDVSLAFDSGMKVPPSVIEKFLKPLRSAGRIVVADGSLVAPLRALLPQATLCTLGESLSRLPACRDQLRPGDLYVIDCRAYHADYERLVLYYHRLREEHGIQLNLDLQRIAVPASAPGLSQRLGESPLDDAAHVRWLLKGRKVQRVIAESTEDLAAIRQHSNLPAMHIAELAVLNGH